MKVIQLFALPVRGLFYFYHLQQLVSACSDVCVSVSPADTCGGVWHVVMCVCLFHLQIPVVGYGR